MNDNYLPKLVRIERIVRETSDIKTFHFFISAIKTLERFSQGQERHLLDFIPGQFLEVSCFGKGEVPISICSSPEEKFIKISFRRVGRVTEGLFNLKEKDFLGIRGPFGNGFPIDRLKDKNLIFIAGGIGIAPLSSLLKFIIFKKQVRFDNITLLYGARTPQDVLYKKKLKEWGKCINVFLTVDKPDSKWSAKAGVVTQLINEVKFDPCKALAFICGPEIMMRFTTAKLIELGMEPSNIILSLERYMKCGIGKCGHCYVADKFVCRDGPVFSCEKISNLIPEQII